jgi:quinol monooxygenase YgiN
MSDEDVADEAGFVAIAIHHVAPEHEDAMLEFMRRVIAVTEGAPGLIEFKAVRELSRGVLAGYSRWRSRADFEAGLARITSLAPERRPEWTTVPDEVLMLQEA